MMMMMIYQEDYEAEKRDRERLVSEKETERLRYEAEIVSMKIQVLHLIYLHVQYVQYMWPPLVYMQLYCFVLI